MINIIYESKVTGLILRRNNSKVELLVLKFGDLQYEYFRLPGGGIDENESPISAMYREIKEESGIDSKSIRYLRKIGELRYFKPKTHKQVVMYNYLFLGLAHIPDKFSHTVNSNAKDNGYIYNYEWIDKSKIDQIDPELCQLINPYNLPEFFIDGRKWGMKNRGLNIQNHDDEWSRIYEFEEMEIRDCLDENYIIEHIGSTSVPDLKAKPIIDILIGIKPGGNKESLIEGLQTIGYEYRGENGIPDRCYFKKGNDIITIFHVHAFKNSDNRYEEHLKVRNILIKNEKLRKDYEKYKESSLSLSRGEYTENKTTIMTEIISVKEGAV